MKNTLNSLVSMLLGLALVLMAGRHWRLIFPDNPAAAVYDVWLIGTMLYGAWTVYSAATELIRKDEPSSKQDARRS